MDASSARKMCENGDAISLDNTALMKPTPQPHHSPYHHRQRPFECTSLLMDWAGLDSTGLDQRHPSTIADHQDKEAHERSRTRCSHSVGGEQQHLSTQRRFDRSILQGDVQHQWQWSLPTPMPPVPVVSTFALHYRKVKYCKGLP